MARAVLTGVPVSSGVSIGKAFFINRRSPDHIPRHILPPERRAEEVQRLLDAFAAEQHALLDALDKVPADLKEHASLINTHLMISRDKKLSGKAVEFILGMGATAEWALEKALDGVAKAFAAVDDPYIRERIQDVRLVADRVMARLLRQLAEPEALFKAVVTRVVLMAYDLSPADTVGFEVSKIMSFATVKGGKTSHTGILARSLQIPALVGVAGLEEAVRDDDLVVIDALKGRILVDPTESELALYADLKFRFENYQHVIHRECTLPGETVDGYRVAVYTNIELFEEVSAALDSGGEGVGLYRTEYSYINREKLPTEDELAEEYADLAAIMAPRRVVFRTLDLGADKLSHRIESPTEANPALGLRAIRFCFKHRELFRAQLRAILRAGLKGNSAMMFPMISGVNELRQAKAELDSVKEELRREGVPFAGDMPVGIMVELPAAVMIAEHLAAEVDFFSIGTNDLIQYSIGIDRTNQHVSYLYQPLHPAVLRSIKHTIDMGHQAGIEVGVCGELASDPYCIPILMGMGIDYISLTPQAVPGIKRVIRQTTMSECKRLLSDVLKCSTVDVINALVKDSIFKRFPEELTFFSSILDGDDR